MNAAKQISRLTNWQIGLFVGPILLQILRMVSPMPFGESGQLPFAIARFSLTAICLIAVGVLEFKKRKLRNPPDGKPAEI